MSIQLEFLPDSDICRIQAHGKISVNDYNQYEQEVEEKIKEYGKINLLFEMSDFRGWSIRGLWEDFLFDVKHFTSFEKIAFVGDRLWERELSWFCKPFIWATIRYFPFEEQAEALHWLQEPLKKKVRTPEESSRENELKEKIVQHEPLVPVYSNDDFYTVEILANTLRDTNIPCVVDSPTQGGFSGILPVSLAVFKSDVPKAEEIIRQFNGENFLTQAETVENHNVKLEENEQTEQYSQNIQAEQNKKNKQTEHIGVNKKTEQNKKNESVDKTNDNYSNENSTNSPECPMDTKSHCENLNCKNSCSEELDIEELNIEKPDVEESVCQKKDGEKCSDAENSEFVQQSVGIPHWGTVDCLEFVAKYGYI